MILNLKKFNLGIKYVIVISVLSFKFMNFLAYHLKIKLAFKNDY